MPKLAIMDSLRLRWKRSIPADALKSSSLFDLKEGEEIVLTYTSASDKMKFYQNSYARASKFRNDKYPDNS